MEDLRVAVVGVGALGRHHARILHNLEHVNLVAVADANLSQAQHIAQTHDCDATHDYTSLVDHIQAVSIAAPTFLHHEIATFFLREGIPILVEKPIASSVDQARDLTSLATDQNLPLAVGHVERFNPAYQTAKELAGRPRYIRTERVSPFAFRSGDIGVVLDLMIHDIDLVLDLTGSRVARVEAFGSSLLGKQEDAATARLIFENGCIADLVVNRVNPFARRSLQIWSEAGCTNADLTTRQVGRLSPADDVRFGNGPLQRASIPGANIDQLKQELFTRDFQWTTPSVSDADALTAELSNFVDSVRNNARPLVSGQDGLSALVIAERILHCIERHQWDGHANGPTGPMAWWPQAESQDQPLRRAA